MRPIRGRGSTSASAAGWRRCWSNDRRKIELLNSLLMSMPGTPIVYYGDEIGMGDNIYPRRPQRRAHADAVVARPQRRLLAGRSGAAVSCRRSWTRSTATSAVNVEAQSAQPVVPAQLDEAADRRAPGAPALRPRHADVPLPGNRKVLAYLRAVRGRDACFCVANMSRARRRRSSSICPTSRAGCRWSCSGAAPFPPIGELALSADPAGLRLLLVRSRGRCRSRGSGGRKLLCPSRRPTVCSSPED